MCRCKGFPRDWPEPPGSQGGEGGTGEGPLLPPRKDSFYSTRPKSEHLGDGHFHDSGAGEMRPGTAPCAPAVEIGSPGCRLKIWSEGVRAGLLHLTQVRQVRDQDRAGGGDPPWPHPSGGGCQPFGGVASGPAQPLVGERSARAPPPAYKSGAALQLAQFSLRPVTRTLRETHRPDSPW